MAVIEQWTGATADALRLALRMTNEQFAEKLGVGLRTVARWRADPTLVPGADTQALLDTLLRNATTEVQDRFTSLQAPVPAPRTPPDEPSLSGLQTTLQWLDEHAGWTSGTARQRVAAEVRRLDVQARHDRSHARTQVGRAAVASALTRYYGSSPVFAPYRATVGGQLITTSVLIRPDWLDLALPLGQGHDPSTLTGARTPVELNETGAEAAVGRIAHTAATGARMINAALYELHSIDITAAGLTAQLGVTDFLSYALTLDLLEAELVDAIAAGTLDDLPLRGQYLPDLASVTAVNRRLCAGGIVTLFAAARPGSRRRPGQGDYVFLVQERSTRTLNANRRLAVIPKAFHQPIADYSDDAQFSATIEREMEEELFGRDDLDEGHGRADPLHPSRLTEPMRWLADHPDAWSIECTGFGLNLVSGNYEVAGLIVIEDEQWWAQHGGTIQANWEADRLRRYSTLDRDGIGHLVQDDTWSNEALFALLQGLRRLAQTGGTRVDLPPIAMEN